MPHRKELKAFAASLDDIFDDEAWAEDILIRKFGAVNPVEPKLITQAAKAFTGFWKRRTNAQVPSQALSSQKLSNRRVIMRQITLDQAFSQLFSQRAYVTPRFPGGIPNSELSGLNSAIQWETMLVWFLANFEPAQEVFFGFGEAQSPTDRLTSEPVGELRFDGKATFDGNHTYGGKEEHQIGGFGAAP